jgi:Mn-dependent DtxR family transcriptional regulator
MEKLSPAMEDYLKTIYNLSGRSTERLVHVGELASQMCVSKACASRATNTLSEKGLIQKSKYQGVTLTQEGKKRAATLFKRHSIITRFFSEILLVDPIIAEKDACRVEHDISAESYRSIRQYLNTNKSGGSNANPKHSA